MLHGKLQQKVKKYRQFWFILRATLTTIKIWQI